MMMISDSSRHLKRLVGPLCARDLNDGTWNGRVPQLPHRDVTDPHLSGSATAIWRHNRKLCRHSSRHPTSHGFAIARIACVCVMLIFLTDPAVHCRLGSKKMSGNIPRKYANQSNGFTGSLTLRNASPHSIKSTTTKCINHPRVDNVKQTTKYANEVNQHRSGC